MAFLLIGLASIAVALVQIAVMPAATRTWPAALEILLRNIVVVNVGLVNLLAFIGHMFFSDVIATQIGWATGSGFQKELAVAELGYSILGFSCLWLRGIYMALVALAWAIFYFGCGVMHLVDLRQTGNTHPLNAGPVMFYDLILPVVTVVVVVAYLVMNQSASSPKRARLPG